MLDTVSRCATPSLPPFGAHVLLGGPINAAGPGSTATIYGFVPRRR